MPRNVFTATTNCQLWLISSIWNCVEIKRYSAKSVVVIGACWFAITINSQILYVSAEFWKGTVSR
jgi:hypothetical protein